MNCLESLIENRPDNIEYNINVIYGDSRDSTDIEVKKRMNELGKKYGCRVKLTHLPLPRRLDGIEKLAILRNAAIVMSDIERIDYILQIDTDIIFNFNVIDKLIQDMEEIKDASIIAPMIFIEDLYEDRDGENRDGGNRDGENWGCTFYDCWVFRKNGVMFTPYKPYIPIIDRSEIKSKSKRYTYQRPELEKELEELEKLIQDNNGILEVDSVGSFYICRSDVFWRWGVNYGTELRSDRRLFPQRKYESEQIIFSREVRKKTPYKIYVDTRIRVDHINLEEYGKMWH